MQKKYLAIFFISAILTYATVMIDKFLRHGRDPILVKTQQIFEREQVPVVMFGDSTVKQYGRCDKELLGIDEYLSRTMNKRVHTIQHGAYSPLIYQHYAQIFKDSRYKPRLAVIPVNLRAWSPEWADRPIYNFSIRGEYIKLRTAGEMDIAVLFNELALDRDRQLTKSWESQYALSYEGENLGTNGEINRKQVQTNLDCGEHLPTNNDLHILRLKYLWHYGTNARNANAMDAALIETVRKLRLAGVQVLTYLTPINVEDAAVAAGNGIVKHIDKRALAMTNQLEKAGAYVLDLHNMLPAENFIDKAIACEHVNDFGRKAIAQHIARKAEQILETTD